AEAHPQGQGRQHDGHDDRQAEHERVVAQFQAHLHAGHARVMHDADARADDHAAGQQAPAAQAVARDQGQRHERRGDARQAGENGGGRVVIDFRAQVEREHADEVHGPHPGAERETAGAQHDPALGAVGGGLPGDLQAHPGSEDGDEDGQGDQLRCVQAVAEKRRIGGECEHG
ncbi:conserved hypothetical protein, partial [Ricinus communis]